MPTIKTYRKVGAFYIACEEDFSTPIQLLPVVTENYFRVAHHRRVTRPINTSAFNRTYSIDDA